MVHALKKAGRLALPVALALALLVPTVTRAGKSSGIGSHHLTSNPTSPAVVFGGTPVIGMHPFSTTIDVNGTVTGAGLRPLKARVSLDLNAIVKLAEAEGFFSMPSVLTGSRPNVDNGPLFITIYTTSGTKSVTMRPTSDSTRFRQLFGVLSELVSSARE
jgi:hypothetical protein